MEKSKELLLMRYTALVILFIQLFVQGGNTSIVCLVSYLLFVINNNLRIFYLKKDIYKICSTIVELIFIPIIAVNFGGTVIFYLIGVSIDLFTIKSMAIKIVLGGIILFISAEQFTTADLKDNITCLVLIAILFMLLRYIASLYSTKLEAQKLYDKLRISEEKLIEANTELEGYVQSIEEITVLKERNRISREIHDSVGHALSTAIIQLSAMETIAEKEESQLKEMIKNLRLFINDSFQDVKKAVRELKPSEYDNYQGVFRLQDVCKNFEKMTGIKVKTVMSKGEWNLSSKQINHLYRITQEALSNSLKHGKATQVNVIMNFTDDEFIISFNDNGIGTDKIIESGVGLKSIKERAEELNGMVDLKSSKGNGFFIKVMVPREVEV